MEIFEKLNLNFFFLLALSIFLIGGLLKYHELTDEKGMVVSTKEVTASSAVITKLSVSNIQTASSIPVLMYHHIGELPKGSDQIRAGLTISKDEFSQQLNQLYNNGYRTVTLREFMNFLEYNESLPDKSIMITFDDGYKDAFENAIPLLQEHSYKAVFAIITNFIDRPEYATWGDVSLAYQNGFDIVSHSQTHFDAYNVDAERLREEMAQSRQDIFDHLYFWTDVFIYPFGHFTLEEEKIASNLGFRAAFTTKPGLVSFGTNRFELPRVRVSPGSWKNTFDLILKKTPQKLD